MTRNYHFSSRKGVAKAIFLLSIALLTDRAHFHLNAFHSTLREHHINYSLSKKSNIQISYCSLLSLLLYEVSTRAVFLVFHNGNETAS